MSVAFAMSLMAGTVEVCPFVKFIYSEKATKVCKISTLLLSVCTVGKSKVEISQKDLGQKMTPVKVRDVLIKS